MIRWLNRLSHTLIVLAVVAGPPAAVTAWLLTDQPRLRVTAEQVRGWLTDPPPDATALTLIAAAATVLWLLAATLIVRAVVRNTLRAWRRLRRLQLPTPAQATAGSLAGTALLGFPALDAAATDTGPPRAAAAGLSPTPADPAQPPRSISPPAPVNETTGLVLPDGGWLPDRDAHHIAAMVGLFWLRRRQTYQPNRSGRDTAPDLPAAALAATAHTNGTPLADAPPEPMPIEHIPAGVIALAGSGAHAAARAMVVTTLMANNTIAAVRARVCITNTDFAELFNDWHPPSPVPGLHLGNTADDVLDATSPASHGGPDSPATPAPVLHVTSGPPHRGGRRHADTAIRTIVFAHAASADAVWHVDEHGTLQLPGQTDVRQRLCVLSARTAADLLALISHAHGLTHRPSTGHPAIPAGTPPTRQAGTAVASIAPASRPARLDVIGELRLAVNDQPIAVRRTAAWQVLTLLATHPDGLRSRRLITTVWPGPPPATITNRLYTTLSDLRADLKPYLHDAALIVHRDHRYALNPDIVDVDLWWLHTAVRAAAGAITTADRRRASHDVITTFRGDLAAGHTWPWLSQEREAIRQHVVDAYADVLDGLPAREAIDVLREAIKVDPYNENLHRRAVDTLRELGDRTAAARLYEDYRLRVTSVGLKPNLEFQNVRTEEATYRQGD
jgi:DNA-binding SARP family transcriptional activator